MSEGGLHLQGRRPLPPWLAWPLGALMFWFLRTGLLLVWLVVQYGLLRRGSAGLPSGDLRRVVRDPRGDGWRVEPTGSSPLHFRLRDPAQADRLEKALAETAGIRVERGPVPLDRPEWVLAFLAGLLLVSLLGTLSLG